MIPRNVSFLVSNSYDYSKSSEENYRHQDASFVGKYKEIRNRLDYSYHSRYSEERQLLQDKLIEKFLKTIVYDRSRNVLCEVPLENWIVFTAGPMGAGKGHTIEWLYKNDLFPFDAFVNVDPDKIRNLLPEFNTYIQHNISTAGSLTQKEVGYISEILSYDALKDGRNVLVDGSLRNTHWYLEYFKNLREEFPIIKIAIIEVTAKPSTVLARAAKRALVTGRVVPENIILDSMEKIPKSIEILTAHTNYVAKFLNEDEEIEPRLIHCIMHSDDCRNVTWSIKLIEDNQYQHSIIRDEKLQYKQNNSQHSYEYLYYNQNDNISFCIQSWKDNFRDVWEMKCALPLPISSPKTPRSPRSQYSDNDITDDCIDEYSCRINSNI